MDREDQSQVYINKNIVNLYTGTGAGYFNYKTFGQILT